MERRLSLRLLGGYSHPISSPGIVCPLVDTVGFTISRTFSLAWYFGLVWFCLVLLKSENTQSSDPPNE